MTNLFVVSYHEVQIAGFRIFSSYEEALKEYLKHCILETKSVLADDDDCCEEDCEEVDGEESTDNDEDDECDGSDEEEDEFDEMSAVFEVQELQGNEYITTKEWDYEYFQQLIEDKDDDEIIAFIDKLEKELDADRIPDEVLQLFKV